MNLDRTTESIFHFIGDWKLVIESLILRLNYDEFSAEAAEAREDELLEFSAADLKAPYRLDDYDPALKYLPEPLPTQVMPRAEFAFEPDPVAVIPLPKLFFGSVGEPADWTILGTSGQLPPGFHIAAPSDVAAVSVQTISLRDADSVGDVSRMAAPELFQRELLEVVALAETMEGPGGADLDALGAIRNDAITSIAETVRTFREPVLDGAATGLLRDDAVEGNFVNGVAADELPDLDDLLPGAIRDNRGLTEDENAESGEPVEEYKLDPVLDKEASAEKTPFDIGSGHRVVTGMNEAHNSVSLLTNMIDAPVIVVGGDVHKLTSVSQVNVASNHDIGTTIDEAGVNAFNLARIEVLSEEMSAARAEAEREAAEDDEANIPTLSKLDGSATRQVDASPDTAGSRIEIEGRARSSEGSTAPSPEEARHEAEHVAPPDTPVDLAHPEIWDVRVYEGDLVQLNSFTQVTFALDTDRIEFNIHAASTYLGTGENLLFNDMTAVEIGFSYDLIVIGGNMIDLTLVSQTNVLMDDDILVATDVSASGGDNLLLNQVSITRHGEDSFQEIEDHFENAVDRLEDGIEELEDEVVEDELFLGLDALRVLYITGDLIKATAISQTNIMGDQDQVSLARDSFARDAGDMLEIVTGSNALTNTAVLEDHGLDSTVMAAGDVYDDALLYTAELIDTDAAPTGVDLPALAQEAVAFLADDMLVPAPDEAVPSLQPLGTDSGDVLQSMLA